LEVFSHEDGIALGDDNAARRERTGIDAGRETVFLGTVIR